MRQIEHNQVMHQLRVRECDIPGHGPAPIVPDDCCLFLTQVPHNGNDIVNATGYSLRITDR